MISQAVSRLSRVWAPSGGITAASIEDGHAKLIRAGFLRQSHAGIFHMLPLGRRVQNKVESLVARHMEDSLAASRVSLSSISTETLWEASGRLKKIGSEVSSPSSAFLPLSCRTSTYTSDHSFSAFQIERVCRICFPQRMRRRSPHWLPGQYGPIKTCPFVFTRSPPSTVTRLVPGMAFSAVVNLS